MGKKSGEYERKSEVRKYYSICYNTSTRRKKKCIKSRVHCIAHGADRERSNLSALRELVPLSNTRIKWEKIYIFYTLNGMLYLWLKLCAVCICVYTDDIRWRIKYDRCAQQQREKRKKVWSLTLGFRNEYF